MMIFFTISTITVVWVHAMRWLYGVHVYKLWLEVEIVFGVERDVGGWSGRPVLTMSTSDAVDSVGAVDR